MKYAYVICEKDAENGFPSFRHEVVEAGSEEEAYAVGHRTVRQPADGRGINDYAFALPATDVTPEWAQAAERGTFAGDRTGRAPMTAGNSVAKETANEMADRHAKEYGDLVREVRAGTAKRWAVTNMLKRQRAEVRAAFPRVDGAGFWQDSVEYLAKEMTPKDPRDFWRNREPGSSVAPRYDLLPGSPLLRVVRRYEKGAEIFGEWDWWKNPRDFENTLNHILDHLRLAADRHRRFMAGETPDPREIDDDLAASAWGCFALMAWQEKEKL